MLAGVLGAALAIFLLGIRKYRKEGPVGSPFTKVAQVFVAAARKWRVEGTRDGGDVLYYGDETCCADWDCQPKARILARTKRFRYQNDSNLNSV